MLSYIMHLFLCDFSWNTHLQFVGDSMCRHTTISCQHMGLHNIPIRTQTQDCSCHVYYISWVVTLLSIVEDKQKGLTQIPYYIKECSGMCNAAMTDYNI